MPAGVKYVTDMFHAGKDGMPWHGISTPFEEDSPYLRDADAAGEYCGMFEQVNKEEILLAKNAIQIIKDLRDGFTTYEKAIEQIGDMSETEFFSIFNTVRNKTHAVMGSRYEPYQTKQMAEWIQPILDTGEMILATGGMLDEGSKAWFLAKMNRDNSEIVKGDEVAKFILISNSHDGTRSIAAGFTPVRVVCANTLAMAMHSAASKLLKVRHTKSAVETMEKVREVMNLANQEFEATADQYRFLASKQVNAAGLKKFVKIICNVEDKKDEDISTRTINTMSRIVELFEGGLGTSIAGVRGTYWGAYNAVTEWLNYERGRTAENRLNSLWFGPNMKANTDALKVAVDVANGKYNLA